MKATNQDEEDQIEFKALSLQNKKLYQKFRRTLFEISYKKMYKEIGGKSLQLIKDLVKTSLNLEVSTRPNYMIDILYQKATFTS